MTGTELRTIRTRLRLTQEELGKRLGVRKNTVWRWETEMRHIPEPVARLVPYLAKEGRTERKKPKQS
jgi:transcriptional regulator with XRE-family HTH domain